MTATRTFTSFVATVLSTVTQTLTFINPTLETQTLTRTITSVVARQKRAVSAIATKTNSGANATYEKRQAVEAPPATGAAVVQTSTTTVATTATITAQAGTRTRLITVFATVTVAPNAVITVFTTTTIFTTSRTGAPSTVTTTGTSTQETASSAPVMSSEVTREPVASSGTVTATGPRPTNSDETSIGTTEISSTPTEPTSSGSPPVSTSVSMTRSSTTTETTGTSTTAQQSPTSGPPPGSSVPGSAFSSDQIAGIVLGVIFFIFLVIVVSLLLRRMVQKRRATKAQMQHWLGHEGHAATAPFNSPATSYSTPGDANQVRIVIRPAPRGAAGSDQTAWPVPPGHELSPTLFLDNGGNTHPRNSAWTPPRSRQWSITSDFGGITTTDTPTVSPPEPAVVRYSAVPSSEAMGRQSVLGDSRAHSLYDFENLYPLAAADGGSSENPANGSGDVHNSSRANAHGEVSGAESGSSGRPRTRLSPPPLARSSTGHNAGSIGIGRAM